MSSSFELVASVRVSSTLETSSSSNIWHFDVGLATCPIGFACFKDNLGGGPFVIANGRGRRPSDHLMTQEEESSPIFQGKKVRGLFFQGEEHTASLGASGGSSFLALQEARPSFVSLLRRQFSCSIVLCLARFALLSRQEVFSRQWTRPCLAPLSRGKAKPWSVVKGQGQALFHRQVARPSFARSPSASF